MKKKIENCELKDVVGGYEGGYEDESQPLVKLSRYKVCAVCGEKYDASKNACPKCGSTSIK